MVLEGATTTNERPPARPHAAEAIGFDCVTPSSCRRWLLRPCNPSGPADAYYYTYSTFAIVSGACFDRFGAKYVLPIGVSVIAPSWIAASASTPLNVSWATRRQPKAGRSLSQRRRRASAFWWSVPGRAEIGGELPAHGCDLHRLVDIRHPQIRRRGLERKPLAAPPGRTRPASAVGR